VRTITDIKEMQNYSKEQKRNRKIIAFVPTMGNLHAGHISLVKTAKRKCDILVVSLFVNPTQFGAGEDFDSYPRTFKEDIIKLEREGVDIIFYPSEKEMYENSKTSVYVDEYSSILCGISRPSHFRGVTTVVAKLFNIVKPDIVLFGEKDAQQAFIIRKMVKDLNFDITIETGEIIRESNGLAMSSRNSYLTDIQRKQASHIYKSIIGAKDLIRNGERDIENIKNYICKIIKDSGIEKIEYIEIVDDNNFNLIDSGLGKRMKSDKPKVMHKILGKPMLEYVIESSKKAGIDKQIIIVGNKKEEIIDYFGNDLIYMEQRNLLGTGDAIKSAVEQIDDSDTIIILCGDAPCITSETLKKALLFHNSQDISCTLLTAIVDNPYGYGRVIEYNDYVTEIIEEKDANEKIGRIKSVNSGFYIFNGKTLKESLSYLNDNNTQREYYLTDTISILNNKLNKRVKSFRIDDPFEMTGINDRNRLSLVETTMLNNLKKELMISGVTLHLPETIYIEKDVIIEKDVEIYPNVTIQGKSVIHKGTIINAGSFIKDANIEQNSYIKANTKIDG
jgi:pantoate--beta-alanine ligase